MDSIARTQKLSRLDHPVAFRAWIASGMNLAEAARVAKRTRAAVKQWSLDEDWQGHADVMLQQIIDGIGEELAKDGAAQYDKAKQLADYWLDLAHCLAIDVARTREEILKYDAETELLPVKERAGRALARPFLNSKQVDAARNAYLAAIEGNDKLYSWSKINLHLSGNVKVETITPAEQALIDQMHAEWREKQEGAQA